MEKGDGQERVDREASTVPNNIDVEQPIQENVEEGQNNPTDMQRMLQAMAQMAEQHAKYFEAQAKVHEG